MSKLDEAVKVIKQGGIVIFPTDTAFGIGCRVDNNKSVEKLLELRKRPTDKAMPVLFDSVVRVNKYVLPYDSKVSDLMKKYWPGALTLVLNANLDKVPENVRAGKLTLGVRIPNHKIILELIEKSNIPITGSSANFAGEKTPFKFEDLDKELIKLVDYVIDGKTNEKNISSTVFDCSSKDWRILREGYVKLDLD